MVSHSLWKPLVSPVSLTYAIIWRRLSEVFEGSIKIEFVVCVCYLKFLNGALFLYLVKGDCVM